MSKINCKNCKQTLTPESDYCNSCGGKVIRNRLTFKNLFEHISETFFNYDNKLLRTFISLFTKPKDVIGGYISGVRKKYVNPISFFGLTLTLIGLEWLILRKFFPHLLNLSSISTSSNEAGLNTIFEFLQNYSSILMVAFVPLYALISRIVFFDKKKYNYTEHVVIFMYMLAVLAILGALINIIGVICGFDLGATTYINTPLQIIYISYCFKRLYSLNTLDIIVRAILSFVVYGILYIIMFVLFILGLYFIEGKESVINLFKGLIPKK